jgi:hypothetical protein
MLGDVSVAITSHIDEATDGDLPHSTVRPFEIFGHFRDLLNGRPPMDPMNAGYAGVDRQRKGRNEI